MPCIVFNIPLVIVRIANICFLHEHIEALYFKISTYALVKISSRKCASDVQMLGSHLSQISYRGIEMEKRALQLGDRDYVSALASGLQIFMAFDAEKPRMTLSEVAAKTDMDRAKARRFLLTLHALGYVRRDGRLFELTPQVLQLGHAYLASNQYRSVIQHYLQDITAELGESSSLSVLDGDDVVYVFRSAAPHRLMAITLAVGTRLPAAYTSMGRVLLAELEEQELEEFLKKVKLQAHTQFSITNVDVLRAEIIKVREQGYAMLDQELALGQIGRAHV